jgi:hypothetical protein
MKKLISLMLTLALMLVAPPSAHAQAPMTAGLPTCLEVKHIEVCYSLTLRNTLKFAVRDHEPHVAGWMPIAEFWLIVQVRYTDGSYDSFDRDITRDDSPTGFPEVTFPIPSGKTPSRLIALTAVPRREDAPVVFKDVLPQ